MYYVVSIKVYTITRNLTSQVTYVMSDEHSKAKHIYNKAQYLCTCYLIIKCVCNENGLSVFCLSYYYYLNKSLFKFIKVWFTLHMLINYLFINVSIVKRPCRIISCRPTKRSLRSCHRIITYIYIFIA